MMEFCEHCYNSRYADGTNDPCPHCDMQNDDDNCWHEDSEVDILTGLARCHYCGEVWYPSRKEFMALRGLKE